MTDKIELSIIIPAYNEETNIRLGALDKVSLYLEHSKKSWEVLLVNDGSTDDTSKLLDGFARENRGFRVIHNQHTGKAGTVITGMLAATGDIILFSDLDQATPIREMEKLLPWFDHGYDVVIGSRSGKREGAPIFRRIMARGFMMIRTIFLGLKGIRDTQCGFKAFKKSVAHEIFHKLKLYGINREVSGSMVTAGFDIEVLYLARLLGYRIKEIPVEWHYVDTRRVSPIKDSIQGLLDIISIWRNSMAGVYKT